MDQKEKRNQEIIKMHNDGLSTQKIADKIGISKAAVYKVVSAHLETVKNSTKITPTPDEKPREQAPTSNQGKRITNFGEYQYTGNCNEYAHKQTGEVVKVKFVKAQHPNKHGHFEIV